jgi:hypothetical protein
MRNPVKVRGTVLMNPIRLRVREEPSCWTSYDQLRPVTTSYDQLRPVRTSYDQLGPDRTR